MTIAEKYYRLFYKVKPEIKLTNEQWKVVKMMHECLRENNKPKLPKGSILVSKKELLYLIAVVNSVEKNMDVIMHESESYERGKKIGKEMNRLTNQRQIFERFQLNIPPKKIK